MVKNARVVLYDGIKTIPAWNVDSDVGWTILSGEGKEETSDTYFARVPWLYRGIVDRANNVAALPFAITKGETDVDTSAEWENKLLMFPNPNLMLKRLEMSLAMTGRAFLFLETNSSGYVKSIKYCTPASISEQYDEKTGELTHYLRQIGTQARRVRVEKSNLVAVYDPDYLTEVGPGKSSAALAALTAAGVLFNADRFISDYFRRGAIKATILAVDGGNMAEAERLQHWWQDVISGIKNAWTAFVVKAQQIKPTVIGEGLESLQNNELTTERRQDIATALGIPESRLWSSAANYATRKEDELAYYNSTIIPEALAIGAALNEQLFTKEHKLEGYKWVFRPETLDIFQEDTAMQAAAAKSFIDFLVACPTAEIARETALLIGFELSETFLQAIDTYFADKEVRAEVMVQQFQRTPETSQDDQEEEEQPMMEEEREPNFMEVRTALNTWRKKSTSAVKRGESADVEFTTSIVPKRTQATLHYELPECKTEGEINRVFMTVNPADPDAELKRACALLERFVHEPA